MSGFTKLFASITESSVWVADDKTLRVWVAMLARCDARGVVEGSVPGFASLCRMSIEEFEERVRILASPDPYSRTTDHEGRRIKSIEGGWLVLNYVKYRERGQSKAGSSAEKVRLWREKKRAEKSGLHQVTRNPEKLRVRQEAEAEENTLPLGAASERPSPPREPRRRNPLFDALVQIEGGSPEQLTKTAASGIGKVLAEIKAVCPDLTIEELRRRAENYRKVMPRGTKLSAHALAKHWARCGEQQTERRKTIAEQMLER